MVVAGVAEKLAPFACKLLVYAATADNVHATMSASLLTTITKALPATAAASTAANAAAAALTTVAFAHTDKAAALLRASMRSLVASVSVALQAAASEDSMSDGAPAAETEGSIPVAAAIVACSKVNPSLADAVQQALRALPSDDEQTAEAVRLLQQRMSGPIVAAAAAAAAVAVGV